MIFHRYSEDANGARLVGGLVRTGSREMAKESPTDRDSTATLQHDCCDIKEVLVHDNVPSKDAGGGDFADQNGLLVNVHESEGSLVDIYCNMALSQPPLSLAPCGRRAVLCRIREVHNQF